MAGKHFPFSNSRSSLSLPSIAMAALSLLVVASIIFFFSSSSYRCFPDQNSTNIISRTSNPKTSLPPAEYSFVASLEKFLTSRSQLASRSAGGPDSAEAVDAAISAAETERFGRDLWSDLSVVRVYVYEMPSKFTYDLLWLFRNTYRETANVTSNGSPVHRLIEQGKGGC